MGERTQHDALVGAKFAIADGYTPVLGDKVEVSDDYEVQAATADSVPVGEVFAINQGSDNVAASVTVEMNGAKVDRLIASGIIAAGALVKIASATEVIVWVSGTDDASIVYGLALEGAGDTESLDVLVK